MTQFLANKYTRWYWQIIEKAKENREGERHHILPKSLGGNNKKTNIVRLSYRAHYLVHWLLTKMVAGVERSKMCFALHSFRSTQHGKRMIASWQIEIARKAYAGIPKENHPRYGTKVGAYQSARISMTNKQRAGKNHPFFGKTRPVHSAHMKIAMIGKNKGKKRIVRKCPHCGYEGKAPVIFRFHFARCKHAS